MFSEGIAHLYLITGFDYACSPPLINKIQFVIRLFIGYIMTIRSTFPHQKNTTQCSRQIVYTQSIFSAVEKLPAFTSPFLRFITFTNYSHRQRCITPVPSPVRSQPLADQIF